MATPNIPSKSVNAWIYLDEDEPKGTGYTSANSGYQSLVNNNVYQSTDMLFICFFSVVPDGKDYFTIQIGNVDTVHPDGSTTGQYLAYTMRDARAQNPGVKLFATLNYNTDNLSQIFSAEQSQWPVDVTNFANNVKNYLLANSMNGLDIDWEPWLSTSISPYQFGILFTAIRAAFDTADTHLYLSLSPSEVGNMDVPTVNSCFDICNLQLYGGASPTEFTGVGVNPQLLAYGAKFESCLQNADEVYTGALFGFYYNSQHYVYNNITQWRLNSGNYVYEQSQQLLLYEFAYDVMTSSFDDGAIVAGAGNPAISNMIIRSGDVLDAVQATNAGTFNGQWGLLGLLQHGGNGGIENAIAINAGDAISEVSGYTGNWFGWNVVAQLTIKTRNGVMYGPYGTMNHVTGPIPFTFTAPAGQSIVAFNGATTQVPIAGGNTTLVVSSLNVSVA